MSTLSSGFHPVQMACRLRLNNGAWRPLGLNTALQPKHQNAPGQDVFEALIVGLVLRDRIDQWIRCDYQRRRVLSDGTIAPLDLSPAADRLAGYTADRNLADTGVRGVNLKLAIRRQAPNEWQPDRSLQLAALDLAANQMLRRLTVPRVKGVIVT